jgi:hypothetical protein
MSDCGEGIKKSQKRAPYLDQINLVKGFITPRLLDIKDRDDVLMVEIPQQLHLAQRPQAEHGMIEWGDLLDGNLLSGGLVDGGTIRDGQTLPRLRPSAPPRLIAYHTTPYAPSPTTSWMSYCSLTLKDIFRAPPFCALLMVADCLELAGLSSMRQTADSASWQLLSRMLQLAESKK